MEVNKYTKEKLKEKIIEDEIKAEIKFDKNKGTLNKKLINFKFQKDLNKQDFNQQNSFNYNKKNIFKPINEDEKKFISNPTIRLKRTPIGGEKPTLELPFEKNYSYNNKQMMQVQNTQPHNNRENNNLKYQPYTMIEKSNYMLKELEEIKKLQILNPMQKINKNSALKEVEEFQNLIQKQNEKYLQNMNFINQNLYQNHNNNKMSNSYKDILYTEHSNEKALEKFNYSAIFDPEIMKILNPNTSDKISKKNNDILPKKNEKINNNMNSSLYSFVDNLSHPPSREFRCSRHFLEFEGRTDYNKKNPRNKGKSIRNRMFSYNGFDRQKKKLDQVIRRLSFREINFLTPIIIDSKEVKEKLINDNKEINKKMMGKKKFNIRNKFRNFDNMLKEIKGDDIVKIIYSIEGIIQTETKKTVSNPKQPWRIPLKL